MTKAKLQSDPAPWLVIDRLTNGADGETHFIRSRIPDTGYQIGHSGVRQILGSIKLSSDEISVRQIPAGTNIHLSAPERRLVSVLSGVMEVTASDGTTRSWERGTLFLATDTGDGKGHRTRAVGGPVTVLVIPIDDDVDLDSWTVTGP